jgi:signal transduction histidine kinase
MGHEIRTPVSASLGYHDLLALKLEATLGPEEREHLRRATAAGQHLLRLVEEILDYARLEAQRVTVERRAFRLADPVAAALDLVGEQARARRLDLVDAVSGSAAEVRCTGDEHRVRQIFINLVANATRLTAAGGRITVSAGTAVVPSPDAVLAGDDPWVYLRVEDTGAGIPADRCEAIFEPFEQADATIEAQRGGTGLGLAISRRLARPMGGDLTVRSEVGVLPVAPRGRTRAGNCPDGASRPGRRPATELNATA